MTKTALLPVALGFILSACAQEAGSTTGAPAGTNDAVTGSSTTTVQGSIDFALKGNTVDSNSAGDSNSVQCQLAFKATNSSKADVISVIAEFRIANAGSGTVIEETSTLTMPFAIAPGETKDAWGPITVNDHKCSDLDVTVLAHTTGMCRTKDKSPCPAYKLSGTGVASAK